MIKEKKARSYTVRGHRVSFYVECIQEGKDITVGQEYPVINSFGVKNGFKLEILNDDDTLEEYGRNLFKKID